MIEASWLNVGSLILGLIAWGIPIINLIQHNKGNLRRAVMSSSISLSACAISLCMQIFYTDHLIKIGDLTALMDTSSAVASISVILLIVTIILNSISLAIVGRKKSQEQ